MTLSRAVVREPMVAARDSASGVTYLETTRSDREWDGTGRPPVDTGSATVNVTVAEGDEYALWAHMYYQHIDANSFWIRIDNGPPIKMGNDDGRYGQWNWVGWRDGYDGNRVVVELSRGSHTIEILGREEGARIDSILVTSDLDYVPR